MCVCVRINVCMRVCLAPGLITIAGGKWTTYRQMGEDVVDRVLEEEKKRAASSSSSSTEYCSVCSSKGWVSASISTPFSVPDVDSKNVSNRDFVGLCVRIIFRRTSERVSKLC